MTLQASGAISLSEIQTEYGGENPISMSEYYKSGGNGYVPTTVSVDVTPSSLSATYSNARPYSQYFHAPTIGTSSLPDGYDGSSLYSHKLWADNSSAESCNSTFYVDQVGTYSYYIVPYAANTGTYNKLYVNGSEVASHGSSGSGTFSITDTSHAINVVAYFVPGAGWSSNAWYIGGSAYNSRSIDDPANEDVPTSGGLSLSNYYGGRGS